MKPLTLVLAIGLSISLLANAFFLLSLVDTAHGWSDQLSVSRHMRDERAALRSLSLRLARGAPHRQAFEAVLRETSQDEPYDKDGWFGRYPLVARFDGDHLSDVCWTVSYSNEKGPCSTAILEGRSAASASTP